MEESPTRSSSEEERGGFGSSMTAGAILATIFAPFASLVVALIWHGSERNEARRAFLRTWAQVSGGLVVLYLVLALVLFVSFSSGVGGTDRDESGPCLGGPIPGASGEHLGGDRYRFPCVFGGSDVIRLPSSP
jgi:hypothetical protein